MLMPLIRLMRPGDWIKNVFVLPAIVFWAAGSWGEPMGDKIVATACAFAAFCLISSGFYAINDVLDARRDRDHPVKRRRPVASGEVLPGVAIGLGLALIAAALVVAALVNRPLVANLLAYGVVQLLYNLGIKRVMLVDVVAVATGFALRATAGAVAIEVQISAWLVLCVFFLCLYLGFIKRMCDLVSAETGGARDGWKSPAGYDDRAELDWLLVVSAVVAIVTYLMYAFSEHAHILFGPRATGFAMLSPLVMIAIHRFYRRARRGASDSPLAALREDRVVLATVALFAAGVLATLYVPFVKQVLERLFIAGGP